MGKRSSQNLDRLREIVAIMEGSTLSSLEYEDGDLEVRLTRGNQFLPAGSPDVVTRTVATASQGIIQAPVGGTFYAAPSPSDEPLVSVGDTVERGQTLGFLEVNTLLEKIESGTAGVIAEVLIENGASVGAGSPLFRLTPRP